MIHCRIKVSITLPTAIHQIYTLKLLALPLPNAVAAMAGLTCVSRIDQHQRHTRTHTFVGQELTQLVERPTIGASSFRLISWLLVRAFSNAGQIFYGNAPVVGFCLFDESMANGVIDSCLEAPFSARQPCLQLPNSSSTAASAFRGFVLQLCSLFGAFVSQLG
jgi:hypothetical protein